MERDMNELAETCNRNIVIIRQDIKLLDSVIKILAHHLINVCIERKPGKLIKLSTFDNKEIEEYELFIELDDNKLKIVKSKSRSERNILNNMINLNELEEKLKLMFGLTLDF